MLLGSVPGCIFCVKILVSHLLKTPCLWKITQRKRIPIMPISMALIRVGYVLNIPSLTMQRILPKNCILYSSHKIQIFIYFQESSNKELYVVLQPKSECILHFSSFYGSLDYFYFSSTLYDMFIETTVEFLQFIFKFEANLFIQLFQPISSTDGKYLN